MRERFTLPDDELEPLEHRRRMLGSLLAGDAGETALLLLDSHHLDTPEIEAMLAAHTAAPQAQPEPAEEPTPRLNLISAKEANRPSTPGPTLPRGPTFFCRVVNVPQVNNSE